MSNQIKQEHNKWSFGVEWSSNNTVQPKFKNLKEEVLYNSFAPISKDKWNDILSKSQSILNCRMGSSDRIKYGQILRKNHIKLKHIITIKLYCDDDKLQREFRKCFIAKYQNTDDYQQRLSQFFHWRRELKAAFTAFSKITTNHKPNKRHLLYHGVTCKSIIDQQKGTYYGPISTTSDINIARDFAGKHGMILVIEPNYISSTAIDTALISEFPHEKEILLYDPQITIKNFIHSADFDEHYAYYKQLYIDYNFECKLSPNDVIKTLKNNMTASSHSDHDCEETKGNHDDIVCIGCDENEKEEKQYQLSLNQEDKMHLDLLCVIYQCAQDFLCNLTKYQQNQQLNAQQDINEILKQFKKISIPKPLYLQFLDIKDINSTQCNYVLSEYIRVSS